MPGARYFLLFVTLFFLFVGRAPGHSGTWQSGVDDAVYEHAPELSIISSGWYREYGSDTHIRLSGGSHLIFEGRQMVSHLGLIGAAAAFAAFLGRVPDLVGYDSSSLAAKVITTIPVLIWPALIAKQAFDTAGASRFHTQRYPVRIVDNPDLARQFSLSFEYSPAWQKIEIRSALQAFNRSTENFRSAGNKPLPQDPLAKLCQLIDYLQVDRLELHWEGSTSPVELKFWLPDSTLVSIEVSYWGKLLTARLKNQELPALLSFLQPSGLNQLNNALTCFYQGSIGTGVCPTGHLTTEAEGRRYIRLRYKPVRKFNLPMLQGKQVDHRFLVPLKPCKEGQCAMAMVWFANVNKGGQSRSLPESQEPVYLYTNPTALAHISKNTPNLPTPIVRRVPSWLTDVLALFPYAAVYYGTDRLLLKGMDAIGIGPTQFAAGAGILNAGWLGCAGSQKQGYGQGGFAPQGRNIFAGLKGWATGAVPLSPAEQAVIKALPGQFSREVEYALVPVSEPSLKNTGNSCFQDSVFSYMANTLTENELQGILDGRFFSPLRSEEFKNASAPVRTSFIAFMRGLRGNSSADTVAYLRARFIQNARIYVQTHNRSKQPLFGGPRGVAQQDAQEFYSALNDILGIDENRAAHYNIQRDYNHIIDGLSYHRLTNDRYRSPETADDEAAQRDIWSNMVTLSFPMNEAIYKSHNIQDLTGFIRYRQHPEMMDGSEAVYVSANDLEGAGYTPPATLGTGALVPTRSSLRIAHINQSELTHLNVHAAIFEPIRVGPGTVVSRKTHGISRHLLAGPGKDTLQVEVFSPDGTPHTVNMKLDSVIMHSGSSMQGGHYTTATIKNGRVMLHDDMKSRVHEIIPKNGVTRSPIDTLLNYMHHNHKDPYVFHFTRVGA